MNRSVQQAVEEIRRTYPDRPIDVAPDPDGGAFVRVHQLPIGDQYEPPESWVAFRITFQHPMADIYPHFLIPDLRRKDGKPLGEGFHAGRKWEHPGNSEPATMVSRRSNHRNAATETAVVKLAKVLDWIRSR